MDNVYAQEIRQRYHSSMTYQEYLDTYDKPPPKPQIRPKETPQLLEPLILEGHKGPKIQQQKLTVYSPDDVIFEESENDEKPKALNHIQLQKALKEHNIRIRSQSENLGFSVFRFLQQKKNKFT
ncbi:unnamed protein product [Paramecium pentaurelia]|uniref:Uncharacterized protein n=1 Tax=Paramecium pentaurelia TaxID=43138 RepID=A0A8S1TWZ8_9CILI|nr:unnamed protein product [Paramecium pentaurelia]